jgi:hypothetical protein
MEHKKSLFEPFQEIKEILKQEWGELFIWMGKQVFNPSPVHIIKGGWALFALYQIWQGVQKIVTHYHIDSTMKKKQLSESLLKKY